jgi:hypothetical protein
VLHLLPRSADDRIGLIAVLGGEPAMRGHDLSQGMNLLMIPCRVSRDLSSLLSVTAGALQIFTYLLTARTGGVKVFLRVALDLWGATSASGNFITEVA